MSADAKTLNKLVKQRETEVKKNQKKIVTENRERLEKVDLVRKKNSSLRSKKNDEKESGRKAISRTLMANLVSAADYPDAPPYVPHMINVLKNILGMHMHVISTLNIIFYIFFKNNYRGCNHNSRVRQGHKRTCHCPDWCCFWKWTKAWSTWWQDRHGFGKGKDQYRQ